MTIKAVRIELGDTDPTFPILSDDEIRYFLDKNDWSIRRACLDCAKSIMLKLAMRTDESVDIFSIRGAASARTYMQALQMYITNPDLNKIYDTVTPYAGGISVSDMTTNDANLDNNIVQKPTEDPNRPPTGYFDI
jgi:hypothetical protein